jgi:IclR family acetate operon transcriptional repressor
MTPTQGYSTNSHQSIQRAAAILRCFSEQTPELSVTALSAQLGLHKSTVSRLLAALRRESLVEQDPETRKFRLGTSLVTLAGVVLSGMHLRRAVEPYLGRLADLTQETANITVLDGNECVNVERSASLKNIRAVGWIGRRTPLHCTAAGKALLAYMAPQERRKLLPARLPVFTAKTITKRSALEAELEQVRQQGYALANEEFEEGLTAVAAPIRNRSGRVIAAITVSGPAYRMDPAAIQRFVVPVQEAAGEISARLGQLTEYGEDGG